MLTPSEVCMAKRLAISSTAKPLLTNSRLLITSTSATPLDRSRTYATQTSVGTTPSSSGRRHKRVTVFNDDGHVKWGDLTPREKAARTTQQSFNFGLIAAGAAGTVLVFVYLYTDVFSPDSATVHFNRAVDSIRATPEAVELLGGPGKSISAYGEATWNRWRRNRPIAHRIEVDHVTKAERLHMHFNVQGSDRTGVARLLMIRRVEDGYFRYGHLYIDVPGKERVWVVKEDEKAKKKGGSSKIFGIKWA